MGTKHYLLQLARRRITFVQLVSVLFLSLSMAIQAAPWLGRSIAELEASEDVVQSKPEEQHQEKPAPSETAPPPSRAEQALARLLEMEPASSPYDGSERIVFPERHIAKLEGDLTIDADDVSRLIERARVNRLIEQTDEMSRNRQLAEAAELLSEALPSIQTERLQLVIMHRLGSLYFRLRQFYEAKEMMARSLAIEPDDAALASNLAAVQMTIGRLDEALVTLSDIRMERVRNPQLLFSIHFNLACLYSLKSEIDIAIDHLSQAAQHNPASTLSSWGDPQLDALRNDIRFTELQVMLESWSRQQRVRPPPEIL